MRKLILVMLGCYLYCNALAQNPFFRRDSAWVLVDFNYSFDRNFVQGSNYYQGDRKLLEGRQPVTLHTAGIGITFRVFRNLYLRGGFAATQKGFGSTAAEYTYYSNHPPSVEYIQYEQSETVNFYSLPLMLEYSYLNWQYVSISLTGGITRNFAFENASSCGNSGFEKYIAPVAFNLRYKHILLRAEPFYKHLSGEWSCNDNGSSIIETYGITFRLGVY